MTKLSVIVPCYYNEANIPVTTEELIANEVNFSDKLDFEYVMVDDGSKDGTHQALLRFKDKYPDKVKVVKLVSNVGSYNAIVAGMDVASGDCNVVIGADLQDPPALMVKMYEYWKKGFKLVLGNREDREDKFIGKTISNVFQFMMRKFALSTLPKGGFDYVFFDSEIRDNIVSMQEKNTNSLYLMLWLGYEYVSVPYTRKEREIGKSRWTFSKKIKLFIDSFVAFSFLPIRLISILGMLMGMGALLYGLFVLANWLFIGEDVEGWTSLMMVILFFSSFQMIALGILGEYIWRTMDNSRKRPNYTIEKVE